MRRESGRVEGGEGSRGVEGEGEVRGGERGGGRGGGRVVI